MVQDKLSLRQLDAQGGSVSTAAIVAIVVIGVLSLFGLACIVLYVRKAKKGRIRRESVYGHTDKSIPKESSSIEESPVTVDVTV
mmetsp:Transcript_8238/g.15287  ORF Transcript_8238/g.15287 Transcript_8238/m.15287 type:complete len:84 (-) Transcript_8238:4621-4872(-)